MNFKRFTEGYSVRPNDMRFSCTAAVQVWVDADDIESHEKFEAIKSGPGDENEKIEDLKRIAREVMYDRISEVAVDGVRIDVLGDEISID